MPTFTLKTPIFFGATGDWTLNTPPDGREIAGGLGAKSGVLTRSFTGASIVQTTANGTFAVSAAPSGFLATTVLRANYAWSGSVEPGASLSLAWLGNTVDMFVANQFNIPDNKTLLELTAGFLVQTGALPGAGVVQQIFSDPSFFTVTGNYTIFAFTWSFPQDGDSVSPGDIITITSVGPGGGGIDWTNVTLSVPCGVIVPITQTETEISFAIPDACDGNGITTLTATGNGTQFSGSVPLGTLIILLVNASGIYTLVTGQRHDEYYSNLRDGTTVDIKIPNPTARTGFIGG